jgi:hypothetical protein
MRVFLLMKHPPRPSNSLGVPKVGEVLGAYLDRSIPDRLAEEKNTRQSYYTYAVHTKQVKEQR